MTSPLPPLARAGDTVRIAAHDYLDGTDDATVRISEIAADIDRIRNLEWVRVLVTNPDQPDTAPRPMTVRAAALRQPHGAS